MNEALKPCPFCGEIPLFTDRVPDTGPHRPKDEVWDIKCGSDDCYCSYGADWWLSQDEAGRLWNTRAKE